MKREKRPTKKERKAAERATVPARAMAAQQHEHQHAHIHCIACGKHLDPDMFGEANGADFYRCQHGTNFPHCVACGGRAKELVDEHDRTGKPVQKVAAWH